MATIVGNSGANTLLGNGAGTGNDLLSGLLGADTYVLSIGNGSDVITDAGDTSSGILDRLQLTDRAATSFTFARSGTDLVISLGGSDQVTITQQFDTSAPQNRIERLTDANGFNYVLGTGLTGTSSRDILVGGSGNEALSGGGSNDILFGGAGDDSLNGGDGADLISGGAGNDTIAGAAGNDTATYADATAGVAVNLSITTAQDTKGAGTDLLSSIENLTGSGLDDTLTGNSGSNVLDGGSGGDMLSGAAGADTIRGGAGNDTLYGGSGNDRLDGGDGIDTASYAGGSVGVTVSLAISGAQATGGAGSDSLISIENLTGTSVNDALTGNTGDNVLNGGAGDDTLLGGAGNDDLIGGAGVNTTSYADMTAGISVNLEITTRQNTGAAGSDLLSGISNLIGGAGDDTLTGSSAGNQLSGGAGNDVLIGGAGNDSMDGGAGNDVYRYVATTFGTGDLIAGQSDSLTVGSGDRLDFSPTVEASIKIGGVALANLTSDTAVGSVFDANNNIRMSNGHLQIDFNGDNAQDFDIAITGANTATYSAGSDDFTFASAAATKKIALTFDDGPNPTYTPEVLAILDKYGVHATFFQIGEQLGWGPEYAALSQTLVAHGNLVENHTFTHPSLTSLSTAGVTDELQSTTDAIIAATGQKPAFFRPPYGDYNATVESIGGSMGMQMALWTIDTNDWNQPTVTVSSIVQTVISQAADQAIVLMHDGGGDRSRTVAALDQIIPQLQSMGYDIVTLDQITLPEQWLF